MLVIASAQAAGGFTHKDTTDAVPGFGIKNPLIEQRAEPTYDFGEYTSNHQRLFFGQMQSAGFEKNSDVVSSVKDVFESEQSCKLLPRWKTAGRYGDAVGPENLAAVVDTTRYGPKLMALPPTQHK